MAAQVATIGEPGHDGMGDHSIGQYRLADVLGYQLAMAAITTSLVFSREVGETLQLRPVEYSILALVHEQPRLTPARLASALSVTAPNITAWMGKLERRGLVFRKTSDTDRRAQLLELTAEGERLYREGTRRLIDGERAMLSTLSQGEYTLLKELLRKVAAARRTP